MRSLRHILHAIGVLVALCVVGALLLDEGEVVTLVTEDAAGRHETQVWVVEIEGALYLRAANPRVTWLARLRQQPHVELVRGHGADAERSEYVASIVALDSDLVARIDRAMAEQHGVADRVWHGLTGRRGDVVPVRLRPLRAPPAEIGRYEGGHLPGPGADPARRVGGGPS